MSGYRVTEVSDDMSLTIDHIVNNGNLLIPIVIVSPQPLCASQCLCTNKPEKACLVVVDMGAFTRSLTTYPLSANTSVNAAVFRLWILYALNFY